jgi:cell cycle sensor histidine kinase DivJ
MVEEAAQRRRVTVVRDLSEQAPEVRGDAVRVRQVLINLLSNAIKFSHDNGSVLVTMKRQGGHLNISVTDRGIGMGEESVRRIGEPFFQANEGLSRRYEGTGLGLSIVKGLVDLHKGSLSAVSTPGEGTVVTVLLPLNGPETKTEDTAEVTPLHREPAPTQLPQWRDERRKAL